LPNRLGGKEGVKYFIQMFRRNTFAGIGGLGDPAGSEFNLLPSDEDFGQTLGVYGLGDVLYLHWPLFGPSSIRDTIGLAGDAALNPLTYILADSGGVGTAIQVGRRINSTSLHLGDYELFKKTSLDPYSAMRNAYHQYRHGKIKDLSNQQDNTDFSYRSPAPVLFEKSDNVVIILALGCFKVQEQGTLSVVPKASGGEQRALHTVRLIVF